MYSFKKIFFVLTLMFSFMSTIPSYAKIKPTPVLIDTDMAGDDFGAILYLLKHNNVDVKGIAVSGTGEAHCDRMSGNIAGAVNAFSLIELADKEDAQIPVACGPTMPTQGNHVFPDLWRTESDTVYGVTLRQSTTHLPVGDAVELIVSVLEQSKEKIKILAIGPLTNIALALEQRPDLVTRIDSIIIMGGAVHVPGNLPAPGSSITDNTSAEWNIYIDPHSAKVVFASGVPIQLISLDGTNYAPVTLNFLDRLQENTFTPASQFFFDVLYKQIDYIKIERNNYFWDSLAAAVITNPELCEFNIEPINVVEEEGIESGRTYMDPVFGHSMQVCLKANGKEFEDIFIKTLNN